MDKTAISEIKDRFDRNLERVSNVKSAFAIIHKNDQDERKKDGGKESGAPKDRAQDMLRCAVVFLNMSLEDLLRSLQMQHVKEFLTGKITKPSNDKDDKALNRWNELDKASVKFSDIRDFNESGRNRFDEFVNERAEAYADDFYSKKNFSRMEYVVDVLKFLGILDKIEKHIQDDQQWRSLQKDIDDMMKRRHHIVHKGDKNTKSGRGERKDSSIGTKLVDQWQKKVEQLASAIFAVLS